MPRLNPDEHPTLARARSYNKLRPAGGLFLFTPPIHTSRLVHCDCNAAEVAYGNVVARLGAAVHHNARRAACGMFGSPVNRKRHATLTASAHAETIQTGGYDGSMLNGLNILPSYTDYFRLNAATTGLNTGSVFIGGFFGPIFSGVIADRIGRRPAILWGSAITIIGIILQAAAQNIAMFVVARIILGFGSQISGIAAGVYLSETFPSRWRAWGVGLLNDFY